MTVSRSKPYWKCIYILFCGVINVCNCVCYWKDELCDTLTFPKYELYNFRIKFWMCSLLSILFRNLTSVNHIYIAHKVGKIYLIFNFYVILLIQTNQYCSYHNFTMKRNCVMWKNFQLFISHKQTKDTEELGENESKHVWCSPVNRQRQWWFNLNFKADTYNFKSIYTLP